MPATTTVPSTDTSATGAAPEEVIVTGTRQQGRTKNDSPAPVDVISGAALQATGEQNVFDALAKVLPSLDLPPIGFDTAGLTRAARLRGLSPDDTLVLVDGKRRHVTANIAADTGPVGGVRSRRSGHDPDQPDRSYRGAARWRGGAVWIGCDRRRDQHHPQAQGSWRGRLRAGGGHLRAGWLHQQPGRQHGNIAWREKAFSISSRSTTAITTIPIATVISLLRLLQDQICHPGDRFSSFQTRTRSARSRVIRATTSSILATTPNTMPGRFRSIPLRPTHIGTPRPLRITVIRIRAVPIRARSSIIRAASSLWRPSMRMTIRSR